MFHSKIKKSIVPITINIPLIHRTTFVCCFVLIFLNPSISTTNPIPPNTTSNIRGRSINTSPAKLFKLKNCACSFPNISKPELQNAETDKNIAPNNPFPKLPKYVVVLYSKNNAPIASITSVIMIDFLINFTTPCIVSLFKLSLIVNRLVRFIFLPNITSKS